MDEENWMKSVDRRSIILRSDMDGMNVSDAPCFRQGGGNSDSVLGSSGYAMKICAKLIACLLLHFAGPGFGAETAPPVLRFPDGISWKAVFDAGFRPKHIPGLERKMTGCRNQPLRFELEGSSEAFIIDPGRLSIELRPDDSVRLFMHTSHVPISMEEGEMRLMTFRRIFE
jgi:hypothetical protein